MFAALISRGEIAAAVTAYKNDLTLTLEVFGFEFRKKMVSKADDFGLLRVRTVATSC